MYKRFDLDNHSHVSSSQRQMEETRPSLSRVDTSGVNAKADVDLGGAIPLVHVQVENHHLI
jgi:hypothetical protein